MRSMAVVPLESREFRRRKGSRRGDFVERADISRELAVAVARYALIEHPSPAIVHAQHPVQIAERPAILKTRFHVLQDLILIFVMDDADPPRLQKFIP